MTYQTENSHKIKFKYYVLLCFILVLAGIMKANAQKAVPASVDTTLNGIDTTGMSVEEKLVALALNGPLLKAAINQNNINKYQLKAARNTWVNLLTISANFNDQNVFSQSQNTTFLFPRYFFGVNIPLGTILSGTRVKAAKEQVAVSNNNQEQLILNTKADVLSKYRQYLYMQEIIKIQNQTLEDEETAYLQAKEKFRDAKLTIEEFNVIQKRYNTELTNKSNLQMQMDLIKIEIERITGTTLEKILNRK